MKALLITFLSLFLLEESVEPIKKTCLNNEEKKLYDLIMTYRESKKLPSIPLSAKLTLVAQAHVKDLIENYQDSKKCNYHSWSNKGGWSPCCYTSDHKQAA